MTRHHTLHPARSGPDPSMQAKIALGAPMGASLSTDVQDLASSTVIA
jgi:hypothetical protein